MTDKDVERVAEPIAMLLYCPQCGQQHVDEPDERTPDWTNPPHRSHLCHDCGCIWRPADVPTSGVAAIKTCGKADTWSPERGNAERAAIAAYESAVTDIAKLGTVSLTSLDGHCVRIDFPNREDAERMYAVLTKGSE
jgi:hypothetical protein